MAVTYGSGLSAQYGMKTETTVGTLIPVDTFYEILDESFVFVPTWLDGMGLKANQAYKRVSRTAQSRFDVNGDISMEITDAGHQGLIWSHALGSFNPIVGSAVAATQIGTTTAYKQIHTPGSRAGKSFSAQVGRPQTDATVRAFTYNGTKISKWEFSCQDNKIANTKFTIDAWGESTATALATASYTATAGIFSFADASNFKVGGTASTSGGETTIASGVSVATVCKGVTITGTNGMATDRYGLGNAGTKREQIENAIPTITGSLDGEFTQRTEFYDLFKANTTTALQLDFSHGNAGGGNAFLFSFIFPAVKFKTSTISLNGPDILGQKLGFEAFDDGSGTNPVMQLKIVSTDTTL